MIYDRVGVDASLSQGDIIDECPIMFWNAESSESGLEFSPSHDLARIVVLTQACDLAQSKSNRVLIAVVHEADELVKNGILKSTAIRDQVRAHRVYGWYFLPSTEWYRESIVDFHDVHTVPRLMLEGLIRDGKRTLRITTPYREHLAQHFSTTYSRIALPEPYPTDSPDEAP